MGCFRDSKREGDGTIRKRNPEGIQQNRVSQIPISAKNARSSRYGRMEDTESEGMEYQILSAIRKFYPREAVDGSEAVNYLLQQHERQWNHREQLASEVRGLLAQLEANTASHKLELDQLKTSHKNEQRIEKQKFDKHVTELVGNHKTKVNYLEEQLKTLESKRLEDLKEMDDKYQKDLRDRKDKADLEFKEFNRLLIIDAGNFQPKPDANFRDMFEALQKKVQFFSKRAKWELHCEKETLGAKFDQVWFVGQAKDKHLKLVLENAFWKILCQKLFLTPFGVLGEYGDSLFTTWRNFWAEQSEEPSAFSWPPPNSRAERWRSSTFEVLQKVTTTRGGRMADDTIIVESYKRNCSAVSEALRAVFSQVSREEIGKVPEEIVELACSLALEFGAARCRYQLFAPQEGTIFSRESRGFIRDRNEGSDPGMAEYVVKLFVSPGLMRIGDGRGQSFDRELLRLRPAEVYGVVSGGSKEA